MRATSLLVASLLAAGCAADEASCPDPDDPVAAELQCHMAQFLRARGFDDDQIIVDASTLLGAAGRAAVMERSGWASGGADGTDGVDVDFELGDPALYTNGQHVLYYADRVTLMTFAVGDDDAAFVSAIEVGLDGTVLANGTSRLPH